MVQSFLDVVLPPVLIAVACAGVVLGVVFITIARLRLYAAQLKRIKLDKKALKDSCDDLSDIIAAPGVPDTIRSSAIAAYDRINQMMSGVTRA